MALKDAKVGLVLGSRASNEANWAAVQLARKHLSGAQVFVHPHTGEAGALGAAFEALRVVKRRGHSTFIGLEAAIAFPDDGAALGNGGGVELHVATQWLHEDQKQIAACGPEYAGNGRAAQVHAGEYGFCGG